MKHLIKAIIGLSILWGALVLTGDLTGFAGGVVMRQAFAQRGFPEAGQTYAVTDNRTGHTYNISVVAVASSYTLPSGYTQTGLACVDGTALDTCTAGVKSTYTNSGSRITYTTPSHSSRQSQFNYNGTVQPATIAGPTRGSWIRQNEAMAIIGDTGGGPAGPPDDTGVIDITPLSNGDYILDFSAPWGIESIIVGPGSFI